MKVLKLLLLLFIILFFSLPSYATIVLKDRAVVKGQEILLGEIAHLKENSYNLYNLSIGHAPLPKRSRVIDRDYIKIKLRKLGREDLITGAERVVVTTSYQLLDVEKVVKVVKDYILSRLDNNSYRLEIVRVPERRPIPEGKVEFTVLPIEDITGYHNVSVVIKIDRKEYGRCKVGVKIKEFRDVVVTNNRLKRNHIITKEDVVLEERDITDVKGEAFFKIEDVLGKKTNNSIKEGVILTNSLLFESPTIKKGDMVSIRREIGLVSVSTLGKALDSGMIGEKIKVENLESKKIIEGVVKDRDMVVVE